MTGIETQLRTEWFDAVHRCIQRDTGRTPREWFDELSDGDDERAIASHTSFVRSLKAMYDRRQGPETAAAWYAEHLFRDIEEHSE